MPEWQRALVTGASSGIGAAFARRLAAEGTDVVLVARNADTLEQTAVELRTRHGVTAEVIPADLGTEGGCEPVERRLQDADAPVDLLVNNAGMGTSGAFGTIALERETALIALNITALVRLTHAAVPGMRARRHGGIINISSLTSFQPYPFGANYGASKAYVTSFSKALHTELRDAGVTVLALCPGFTRSNFQESAGIVRTPIPDWMWLEPDDVVDEGLDALRTRRAVRVPGTVFKGWAALTKVLPESALRRVLARGGRHRT